MSWWADLIGVGISIFMSAKEQEAYEEQADLAQQIAEANAKIQEEEAEKALELSKYNADLLEEEAVAQMDLALKNAEAYEVEADYQAWKTDFELDQHWQSVRKLLGKQHVAYMKAGVTESGSVIDVKKDTVRSAATDAFLIAQEGNIAEWRARKQAELTIEEGKLTQKKLQDLAELSVEEGELGFYRGQASAQISRQKGAYQAAELEAQGRASIYSTARTLLSIGSKYL